MQDLIQMGQRARQAARLLRTATAAEKNRALEQIAQALVQRQEEVLQANERDLQAAKEKGTRPAMLDRLRLDAGRMGGIAASVGEVVALTDPVGEVVEGAVRPNGLKIYRTRVPLGVVAMIYEARPNVTVDAAVLCLKAGNACILRGGSEALHSNRALAGVMRDAIRQAGLPEDAVQLVEDTSRETAAALMRLKGYVDVLIPRGGAGLIRSVVENATVPVIETGVGNCHLYVDEGADLEMAARVLDNAKTSRPSVCNAVETLLVHRAVAQAFLPMAKQRLDAHQVQLRGCPETVRILGSQVYPATEEDYATEFDDYILAVRVVDSLQQAVEHIARYGSGHSEAIITESYARSQAFMSQVDAAAVYVNASTRFTDGGEFGLGAEIGISTQKLHARGPMGLRQLTTDKYLVWGSGQIR